MHEHHLVVSRTARYHTLGAPGPAVRDVWFALHGYGQLAASFLEPFRILEDPGRLVVAPEALSRYYTDHASRAVGASWMTREDRGAEIADYVRYLDAVADWVFQRVDRGAARCRVLGFSQGAATACRWAATGATSVDQLILWGGGVPPDLDLRADGRRLAAADLHLVIGERDEFATAGVIDRETQRLEADGIPFHVLRFSGGHRLSKDVLRSLAVARASA